MLFPFDHTGSHSIVYDVMMPSSNKDRDYYTIFSILYIFPLMLLSNDCEYTGIRPYYTVRVYNASFSQSLRLLASFNTASADRIDTSLSLVELLRRKDITSSVLPL